jgi:uncharacterized protein (TIGR02996 family)
VREEQAFLQAILDNPDDDAPRLMYADWLEERDDPRGEYIRLTVAVEGMQQQLPAEDQRTRLRQLREIGRLTVQLKVLQPRMPLEWLAKLNRGRIGRCGLVGLRIDDKYSRACPTVWQRLQETDTPCLRRCGVCTRKVRLCRSVEEINQVLDLGDPFVKVHGAEQ